MTAVPPALLLCAVIALAGLGAAGRWPARPSPPRATAAGRPPVIAAASAAICALALIVLLVAAAAGATGAIRLGGIALAVDPLNLVPLMIVFGAALATLAYGCGEPEPAARVPRLLGPLAAGWALALLAADALSLMLGLLAANLTLWAIAGRRGDPAARLLAAQFAALACLALALDVLIGSSGAGVAFAALRTLPPAGWRAGLVLVATVAAIGLQAAWIPRLRLPPLAAALVGAAFPAVAAYLLIRLLLDLAGPAQPLAWGVPVLMVGVGFALAGGWRAILSPDLTGTLTAATTAQVGLSMLGVGLVAMARAADQTDLAAFALAATLVQLLAHALFKTLLLLGTAAVRNGAGTEAFAVLGGVSRGMPLTTACLLAGAVSLAALPLSAGFVGVWSLLQALYAAARLGGTAVQLLLLGAALAAGLAVALLAFAAARLVGVGLLGRPRTPRGAAAAEPPRAARAVLLALAGLSLLVGLWPAALFGLAAPAVLALTTTRLGLAETWLAIAPPLDPAGDRPLGIAALLGGLGAIAWLIGRASPPARTAPAWADGYAPPPVWLPFGDPALQVDAAAFSDAVQIAATDAGRCWAGAIDRAAPRLRSTASLRIRDWQPVLRRYRLALALGGMFLLLLALAVIEAA